MVAEQEGFKSLTHLVTDGLRVPVVVPSEQRVQISALPYQRGGWGPWARLKPGLLGFGGKLGNRARLLTCL